jgi:hypothetical protein
MTAKHVAQLQRISYPLQDAGSISQKLSAMGKLEYGGRIVLETRSVGNQIRGG